MPEPLSETLTQLITVFEALEHCLTQEYDALVRRDLVAIAECASEKESHSALMDRLKLRLDAQLAHVETGTDSRLATLVTQAEEPLKQELEPLHNRLVEVSTECRHQNAVNGKVVHRAQQSVTELARILSGTNADPLYTASGRTRHAGAGHQLGSA